MAWAPPVAPVISHGGSAAMKPWPKTSHRATTRRPSAKRCGRGASYGEGRRPADGRRWFRWRMIDRHLHRLIPSPYRWSMMVPNMWFHSLQNHAWCFNIRGKGSCRPAPGAAGRWDLGSLWGGRCLSQMDLRDLRGFLQGDLQITMGIEH